MKQVNFKKDDPSVWLQAHSNDDPRIFPLFPDSEEEVAVALQLVKGQLLARFAESREDMLKHAGPKLLWFVVKRHELEQVTEEVSSEPGASGGTVPTADEGEDNP
jgi:hypothetical protein